MTDVLVSGDNAPTITATLYEKDDPTKRVDLSVPVTKVYFQMRRTQDRRLMINRLATIEVPASGEVSYALAADDLAIPGDYVLEWQVVFPDGKKQTTASLHDVEVRRR